MKNQLEDFIRQNREAFDDQVPADGNWAVISRKIFPVSLWNSVRVWQAAALVLFGVCVYLTVPRLQQQEAHARVMKEFRDVESFYVSQIAHKVELIEEIQGGEDAALNGFTHDFKQLEAMYEVLKEEMRVRPSSKVRDALVLNLLVRINLLNQQLHTIETGDAPDTDKTVVNS